MDNRSLPNCVEDEQSVLSYLIFSGNEIERVTDILTPNDFYVLKHRKIFEIMIDLYRKDIRIDSVSIASHMIEKKIDDFPKSYLAELINECPIADNLVVYAKKVKDKSVKRRLIESTNYVLNECFEDIKGSEELVNDAQKAMMAIEYTKIGTESSLISDVLPDYLEKLYAIRDNDGSISGVTSGYESIDFMTSGWQNADLIILAARPGMGKTSFAVNMIDNIVNLNIPAVYFSLEMPKKQIVDRIISKRTRLNGQRFKAASFTNDQMSRITECCNSINDLPLIINDCPDMHYMDIRREARKYKQKNGIKAVFIDYLQLISGDKTRNRVNEMSEISRSMKMMAKELDLPVIALSQLNRMCDQRENKRPRLSDLRDSGSIEQDADIVTFIYREVAYNKDYIYPSESEIIFAKNRNGITGTVNMKFHKDTTTFMEVIK